MFKFSFAMLPIGNSTGFICRPQFFARRGGGGICVILLENMNLAEFQLRRVSVSKSESVATYCTSDEARTFLLWDRKFFHRNQKTAAASCSQWPIHSSSHLANFSVHIHFNSLSSVLQFPGAVALVGSEAEIVFLCLVSTVACCMLLDSIFVLLNEVCCGM